jgi:DNA invertase Pin-like site-specific DNA recombinase
MDTSKSRTLSSEPQLFHIRRAADDLAVIEYNVKVITGKMKELVRELKDSYSLDELADACRVSKTTIYNWLNETNQ